MKKICLVLILALFLLAFTAYAMPLWNVTDKSSIAGYNSIDNVTCYDGTCRGGSYAPATWSYNSYFARTTAENHAFYTNVGCKFSPGWCMGNTEVLYTNWIYTTVLQAGNLSDNSSFSFWYRSYSGYPTCGGTCIMYSMQRPDSSYDSLAIYTDSSARPCFWTDSIPAMCNSSATVNDSTTWHLVVLTWNSVTGKDFYFDNKHIAHSDNTKRLGSGGSGTAGFLGNRWYGGLPGEGYIDDVGVWNKTLSYPEILALSQNASATPEICYDSDNNTYPTLNYNVYGVANYLSISIDDYCLDANTLEEAACLDSTTVGYMVDVYCPTGCVAGACQSCPENWVCGNWSSTCINNFLNRSCYDSNHCGTFASKPDTSLHCVRSGTIYDLNIDDGLVEQGVMDGTISPINSHKGLLPETFDGILNFFRHAFIPMFIIFFLVAFVGVIFTIKAKVSN